MKIFTKKIKNCGECPNFIFWGEDEGLDGWLCECGYDIPSRTTVPEGCKL